MLSKMSVWLSVTLTYTHSLFLFRFEQVFINSLLKEHVSVKKQYFWTGLQDTKGTGEYQWFSQSGQTSRVTYTNWKWGEPGGANLMQYKLNKLYVQTAYASETMLAQGCSDAQGKIACELFI